MCYQLQKPILRSKTAYILVLRKGPSYPSSSLFDQEQTFAYIFVYILRSCILNKKTLILIDEDYLKQHFVNFLKFIFEYSFQIDVNIEKSENYKQNKKQFKNYVVFDLDGIVLHDNDKLLSQKGMKIEKMIIQKFLSEIEPKTSLIVVRNEIQKAFELSKSLSNRIEGYKKNNVVDKVDLKNLFENLIEGQNIKISLSYTKFLIEIVENYFKTEIPMVWKFFLYRV